MSDPYEVLGLDPSAGEEQIRARYLELVRQFPPDRAPERFAEIRAAVDQLKDPRMQWQRRLFFFGSGDSIATLEADVRTRLRKARPTAEGLLSIARSS